VLIPLNEESVREAVRYLKKSQVESIAVMLLFSPLNPKHEQRIAEIIEKHGAKSAALIQVLLEIQHENHWLPREVLHEVSSRLRVPFSQVLHLTSFYKTFDPLVKLNTESI
jgi:N-methylhydantoinase A/oxoprolinase/acetone carboxylase beta subunit